MKKHQLESSIDCNVKDRVGVAECVNRKRVTSIKEWEFNRVALNKTQRVEERILSRYLKNETNINQKKEKKNGRKRSWSMGNGI